VTKKALKLLQLHPSAEGRRERGGGHINFSNTIQVWPGAQLYTVVIANESTTRLWSLHVRLSRLRWRDYGEKLFSDGRQPTVAETSLWMDSDDRLRLVRRRASSYDARSQRPSVAEARTGNRCPAIRRAHANSRYILIDRIMFRKCRSFRQDLSGRPHVDVCWTVYMRASPCTVDSSKWSHRNNVL